MYHKALLAIVLLNICNTSFASVPRTISYQGIITESTGKPPSDGTKTFIFALFADSSSSDTIWSETKELITKQGLFSTNLGDKFPLNIPFDQQYWLSVRVDKSILIERARLSTVPYALRSDTADVAKKLANQTIGQNAHLSGTLSADSISARTIVTTGNIFRVGNQPAGTTNTPTKLQFDNTYSNGATKNKLKISFYEGVADKYGFSVGSRGDMQYFTDGTHDFYINDTLALRIGSPTGRNIGINKDNPLYPLDVGGSANFDNYIRAGYDQNIPSYIGRAAIGFCGHEDFATFCHVDQNTLAGYALAAGANGDNFINCPTGGTINFAVDAAAHSRILPNGNFGIGTTDPGIYKLFVNGPLKIGSQEAVSTPTPTKLMFDNSYSDGQTKYKLKISLHDDGGSGKYGFSIGSIADVQYFSERHHDFYINDTLAMRIGTVNNRNVGIGITIPEYKLDVNGNIRAISTIYPSDRRFKIEITPISKAIDKINALQGVTYRWNRNAFPEKDFSETKQIGLIAQDVEKILPEVVHTDNDGYKSLSYDKLTAVLIEAVKSQQQIIDEQNQKIKNLELLNTKLSDLEKKFIELESRLK
jgi:hypothetical protein